MLYRFLKLLMQGTTRVFFRSITVKNPEAIPAKGPLIILANHPGTFMDPIVIASIIDREVFFLGKGELFRGAFAKWLLPKLNIIPVYRKQDDPSLMSKNEDTFRKCFEHLEKGGAVLIFPEGVSITERKLKPVKTGAARIALGAEARNEFRLGVKIVNIGLNYADQHKFNRDLFINIHEPVSVSAYAGAYSRDHFKAAEAITEEIRRQLESVVISVRDERTDALVKDVETLYRHQLKRERGIRGKDTATEFEITQNIVKAVEYQAEHHPDFVESMRERINLYFAQLRRFNIGDEDLSRSHSSFFRSNMQAFLFLLLGLPVYLYGLINNYIPFELPALLSKNTKDFRGAIGMVLGMFCFIIFYTLQISLVQHFFHLPLLTVLYALSLPLSGFFAYYYWHTFDRIRSRWLLIALFYKRSAAIAGLIAERESIIAEFEKVKKEFLEARY